MQFSFKLLLVFFIVISSNIFSQTYTKVQTKTSSIVKMQSKFHSLKPFFAFTVEGGTSYILSDFKKDMFGPAVQGALEFYFPSSQFLVFGLKASGGYMQLKGKVETGTKIVGENPTKIATGFSTNLYWIGGGLVVATGSGPIVPYISFGGDYILKYRPADFNSNSFYSPPDRKAFLTFYGQGGIKYFLTNSISFNLSLKYDFGKVDDLDGLVSQKKDSYYTILGGFSIHLFSNSRVK